MRARLDIVIPGLCGPLPSHASDLQHESLQRLASLLGNVYAEAENAYVDQLSDLCGTPALPTAALSLCALAQDHASRYCMRLEPVHLKADMDHAIMIDSSIAGITAAESDALVAELNAHFSEDGIEIIAVSTDSWVLLLDDAPGITTHDVESVVARNVNLFLPSGDDAVAWKRFMNEAQMLLHQSEVNLRRMESGLLPLNSLWLEADDSRLEDVDTDFLRVQYDTIVSDDPVARGLASLAGIDHRSVADFDTAAVGDGRQLLVDTSMRRAAASGDATLWLEALTPTLDRLAPMAEAARKLGTAASVYNCSGRRYRLNRKRLFDIFCRPSVDKVMCYDD